MSYFPYTRFDFLTTENYYYPLTFEYDDRDKVSIIVSDEKGVSKALEYGSDYTLEGDKINILYPSKLNQKYLLDITKIYAIRFSGICETPEFQYGVYLDVKKVQKTLENMALQIAEVQMTSENSVKLAYEEWDNANEEPLVQIPTKKERANNFFAFDTNGRVLMVRMADLAIDLQKYIKSGTDPVVVDVSATSFTFPATSNGTVNPYEFSTNLRSAFTVTQGKVRYQAIATKTSPTEKGTFSLWTTPTNIDHYEVVNDVIKGSLATEMKANTALIVVEVKYLDLEGNTGTFRKDISLSKALNGANGKDGVDGYSFTLRIISSNGNAFRVNESVDTTLSIQVLRNGEDITSDMEDSRFKWIRKTDDEIDDEKWNTSSKALYHKSVEITKDDCIGRTVFECEVDLGNL